ncbi:MAG TPA: efflux RND transporter periplasmic adaptor subunit [Hyphomicrobiaceae bacterium]|nr:efflux RND transporter periplasmic adaptor subunit [Hyphomicrobiaceae bacterium]
MVLIRRLLILAAVIGCGYGGYWLYVNYLGKATGANIERASGGSARPVEVSEVQTSRLKRTIDAVATTRARQAIEVVPLVAGRVIEIPVVAGQEVKKGDVLLRLDDDIERANLAEARAKLQQAALALQRAQVLLKSNTVTTATLEQLKADEAAASAEIERAERRLADRTLRAPFGGRVGLTRVEVGARIDSSVVVTTLDDLSEVELEFLLPETVFGETRIGMEVEAEGAAFPGRTFAGKIASIDSRIDRNSRTFKVRAAVPNPERLLPAGMFMRLVVVLSEKVALTVPEEAIVTEGMDTFVYLAKDGKAVRRNVKIGQRQPGLVEVTQGLAAGEPVIVRGIQRLRDGVAIRVSGNEGPAERSRQGGRGSGKGNGT